MSDTPPASYPGEFDIDDHLAGDRGELPLYADMSELDGIEIRSALEG